MSLTVETPKTAEAQTPAAAPREVHSNIVPMAQSPWQMSADIYSSPDSFAHAQRVASSFAASNMVPEHLRKNGISDVLAALGLARAMNAHPILVMQSIFFIGGRAGWATKFMIARANQSKVFSKRIKWRTSGEGVDMKVTAFATLAETGEEVAEEVTMKMAMAEGWTKNAKYQSIPERMLKWRSASALINLNCPEVMFGLPTVEDVEDMVASGQIRDVTPPKSLAASLDAFAGAKPAAEVTDAEEEETERVTQDGEIIEGERVASDATEEEFDADAYLKNAVAQLSKLATVEELEGANASVREALENYGLKLGVWNGEYLKRLDAIQKAAAKRK